MKYSKIMKYDATNWTGINTTIFFSGCTFNCDGCFNKDIQDFNSGEEFTNEVMDEFISYANSDHVTGICILGGEPFQQDLKTLDIFIKRIKNEVGKPVHIWTGFLFENLLSNNDAVNIIKNIDTLVDGRFVKELKDLKLKFRGSSNQRVIDTQKSLELGSTILYE